MKQLPTNRHRSLQIINHCEQIATEIVLDNRSNWFSSWKLLDAETLDGVEFRKLVENTHFTIEN
jgi:ATP-dependent Zn protease